ncbi:hypothetical protein NFJ02_11g05830 [Pycnococcus provasolii]|mmetsp:Transcript_1872/g.4464  ORF Transcript_1872/g.4464 Transcript_1872/m.4464 type:complete len:173 (-) Transcript_1872:643-1161(-)
MEAAAQAEGGAGAGAQAEAPSFRVGGRFCVRATANIAIQPLTMRRGVSYDEAAAATRAFATSSGVPTELAAQARVVAESLEAAAKAAASLAIHVATPSSARERAGEGTVNGTRKKKKERDKVDDVDAEKEERRLAKRARKEEKRRGSKEENLPSSSSKEKKKKKEKKEKTRE